MKQFIFDTLLDEENILNQVRITTELKRLVEKSGHVVLHGMRNSAKTSIIKNIIIPFWKKKHKQPLSIYCDLMAVKDLDDISERFTVSFNEAYGESFILKSVLQKGIKFLSGLKPTFELSSNGSSGNFSLRNESDEAIISFEKILQNVRFLHEQNIPILICIDEFQDISLVKTAEAKLRKALQELPFSIPIIISGSKQHMLTNIFEKPRAPFYQWGSRLEMDKISLSEYCVYIKERINPSLKKTENAVWEYLQNLLMRSPEPINRICYEANLRNLTNLSIKEVDDLVYNYVENNQSSFEARLSYFSNVEIRFLKHLAKSGTIENPHSKKVLQKVNISSPGMIKLLKRLQNDGIITFRNSKYYHTDPFMMHFLIKKRI